VTSKNPVNASCYWKVLSKVFSEKGFHGATVEEVAEVAGVGKGTVYLYFGSKTDLFVSVVRRKLKELRGVVKERLKRIWKGHAQNWLNPSSYIGSSLINQGGLSRLS